VADGGLGDGEGDVLLEREKGERDEGSWGRHRVFWEC